jgi:hypothetical protein
MALQYCGAVASYSMGSIKVVSKVPTDGDLVWQLILSVQASVNITEATKRVNCVTRAAGSAAFRTVPITWVMDSAISTISYQHYNMASFG